MSGYFEALADAANGAAKAALPIPPPIFVQEEEAGFAESETLLEGPRPRATAGAAEYPPPNISANVEASPLPAPVQSAETRERRADADTEPPSEMERESDPNEAAPIAPELVLRLTEQHTAHVTEQIVMPAAVAAPAIEQALAAEPIGDHASSRAAPDVMRSEVVQVEAPASQPTTPQRDAAEPEVIFAAPLVEPAPFPGIEEPPPAQPALSIDIAHIDIRILPPEFAVPPAPIATTSAPQALSLADYLAERSRSAQ